MLQKMANFDYRFLVSELNELVGSRLRKIYEISENRFRLVFYKEREFNLVIDLGIRLNLTKYIDESPYSPTSFAMLLRKHLENGILKKIEQINFDRILVLGIERISYYNLVFEMMGKGNLVLCDEKFTAIGAYRKLSQKQYSFPEMNRKNPIDASENDFDEGGKIVSSLSKNVNLAPFYLEEACARAGVDWSKDVSEISVEDKKKVAKAIRELVGEEKRVFLFYSGEKPIAFSPIKLTKLRDFDCKEFPSFCEALDEYYFQNWQYCFPEERKEHKLRALEHVIQEKEKAVEELKKGVEEATLKGNWVYENYDLVELLISEFREKKFFDKEVVEELNKRGLSVEIKGEKIILEIKEK